MRKCWLPGCRRACRRGMPHASSAAARTEGASHGHRDHSASPAAEPDRTLPPALRRDVPSNVHRICGRGPRVLLDRWPLGYSEPFNDLPVLSVLVVTFNMTAPMTVCMLCRGMPRRATAEMSAAMPILAIVLLALGWLGVVPMGDLALLEHGVMMPVMLVPMFLRLDVYTGRAGHPHRPPVGRAAATSHRCAT